MADRVVADLIRVGILRGDDRIVARDVMDVKYGYVIYDKVRRQSVVKIRRWLASVGIHSTGRYGLWAYLWSHESLLAGANTGRRLYREHARANRRSGPTATAASFALSDR